MITMDKELDLATRSMALSLASTSSSQPAVKGRDTRMRLHFFPIWWNDAAGGRGVITRKHSNYH